MLHVVLDVVINTSLVLFWVVSGMKVSDRLMRDRPDADWIYWVCLVVWPLPAVWWGVALIPRLFSRNDAVPTGAMADPPPVVIQFAERSPHHKPGQGLLRRKHDAPPVILHLPPTQP